MEAQKTFFRARPRCSRFDCLLIEPQMLRRNMEVMMVMTVVRGREQIGRTRLARQELAHELYVGDGESQSLDSWKSLFVGKCWHFPTQLVERCKNAKLNESGISADLTSLPSFRLNIRLRSRIFAALLWAIDATRRRVFFVAAFIEGFDEELDGVCAVLGDESRCDTKFPTWLRGQIAERKNFSSWFRVSVAQKVFSHLSLGIRWFRCKRRRLLGSRSAETELPLDCRRHQSSEDGFHSRSRQQNASFLAHCVLSLPKLSQKWR